MKNILCAQLYFIEETTCFIGKCKYYNDNITQLTKAMTRCCISVVDFRYPVKHFSRHLESHYFNNKLLK